MEHMRTDPARRRRRPKSTKHTTQRARTPQTHVAAHMIRPRGAQVPWAAPRPTLPSCLAGSHIISGSGHGAPRASSLRASLDTIECAVLLRPPPRTTIRDGAAGSRCPARPNRRGGREPNAPAAATNLSRTTSRPAAILRRRHAQAQGLPASRGGGGAECFSPAGHLSLRGPLFASSRLLDWIADVAWPVPARQRCVSEMSTRRWRTAAALAVPPTWITEGLALQGDCFFLVPVSLPRAARPRRGHPSDAGSVALKPSRLPRSDASERLTQILDISGGTVRRHPYISLPRPRRDELLRVLRASTCLVVTSPACPSND
ncbi:hypothetical protein PCL_10649 [Purpureocillium lilacinum]|uniref:Uncharacterized protein n=1 Tax=Purpureocillium lilacinum TaxID=33203 RepID=A0A2U3EBY9_PURLI|nr:hypothetical protein PCL_10649 [Purpureocillium lilacinum]